MRTEGFRGLEPVQIISDGIPVIVRHTVIDDIRASKTTVMEMASTLIVIKFLLKLRIVVVVLEV